MWGKISISMMLLLLIGIMMSGIGLKPLPLGYFDIKITQDWERQEKRNTVGWRIYR